MAGTRDGETSAARSQRELARGTLELALLSALASRRRYGYELLLSLRDLTGGAPEIKEGTIYPLLHRLEDSSYVESAWRAEGRRPARKYYSLTKAGRDQLAALRAEWKRLVEGMDRLLADGEGDR
jgi:PadR family transcriptional regulator PadR